MQNHAAGLMRWIFGYRAYEDMGSHVDYRFARKINNEHDQKLGKNHSPYAYLILKGCSKSIICLATCKSKFL